jgi:hypothetical protein
VNEWAVKVRYWRYDRDQVRGEIRKLLKYFELLSLAVGLLIMGWVSSLDLTRHEELILDSTGYFQSFTKSPLRSTYSQNITLSSPLGVPELVHKSKSYRNERN